LAKTFINIGVYGQQQQKTVIYTISGNLLNNQQCITWTIQL